MPSWKSRVTVALITLFSVIASPPPGVGAQEGSTTTSVPTSTVPTSTVPVAPTDPVPVPVVPPESETTLPVPPETTTTTTIDSQLVEELGQTGEQRAGALRRLRSEQTSDTGLADAISVLERQMEDEEKSLDELRETTNRLDARVRRLNRDVAVIEDEIDILKEYIRERAVKAYMDLGGAHEAIEALTDTTDPSTYEYRRALVVAANSSDEELRKRYEDRKREIDLVRQEVSESANEAKRLREESSERLYTLRKERESTNELRVSLNRRVTEIQAEVASLSQEENSLRAILGYPEVAGESPITGVPTLVNRPASSRGMIWPLEGTFTSAFGMRWGAFHAGIDVSAPTGTPLYAALAGTVIFSGAQGGYGNIVIIDHGDGFTTSYAHMSRLGVGGGQPIGRGELIGLVGSTGNSSGPHVHFETRVNGTPYDPMRFLP